MALLTDRLPGIVCDIDGVIYKGKEAVGNSTKVLPKILAPREELGGKNIPFIFLTNGGGFS